MVRKQLYIEEAQDELGVSEAEFVRRAFRSGDGGVRPGMAMPNLGVRADDARGIGAYLMALR